MSLRKKNKKNGTEELEDMLQYEDPKQLVRKKKKANTQILQITYLVVLLFLGLIIYMVKFTMFDSSSVISNAYNKRQNSFSEKVVRGKIISSNGKVLAQTVTNSDGNEEREYPYGRMFAHVVGFDKKGMSGLESSYNYQLLTSNSNLFNMLLGSRLVNCLIHSEQKKLLTSSRSALAAVIFFSNFLFCISFNLLVFTSLSFFRTL